MVVHVVVFMGRSIGFAAYAWSVVGFTVELGASLPAGFGMGGSCAAGIGCGESAGMVAVVVVGVAACDSCGGSVIAATSLADKSSMLVFARNPGPLNMKAPSLPCSTLITKRMAV